MMSLVQQKSIINSFQVNNYMNLVQKDINVTQIFE